MKKVKPRKDGNKKFSKLKLLIFVLLGICLVLGTSIGVFFFLKSRDPFFHVPSEVLNVGVFEDGSYYIRNASSDIRFMVQSNKKDSYQLTDQDGKKVPSKIVTEHGKNYIVSDKEYEKGAIYYLELVDTKFSDDVLKDASKLVFQIEEEEHADYQYQDNVELVDSSKVDVVSDDRIKVRKGNYSKGDILLLENDNEIFEAYKVEKVDGDNLEVSIPSGNEIFDELDFYVEEYINFEDMTVNPELKEEIQEVAMASPIYQYLARDVYAEEVVPGVSYHSDDDTFYLDISITLKADGKEKMGIPALMNHDLTIEFSYEVSTKATGDVSLGDNVSVDLAIITKSNFHVELSSSNEYLEKISAISEEEYSKSIEEIVQKLQSEVSDVSENTVSLGNVYIPTSIPTVNIYTNAYFNCQISVLVNADADFTTESVQHVGFIMNEDGLNLYRNVSEDNSSLSFSVTGKEEIRVGVGIDVGVCIVNKDLANASISAEVGVYQEAFSTFKAKYESSNHSINAALLAKLEEGIYLDVNVNANIDIWLVEASYSGNLAMEKFPIFTYGSDELVTSIEASSSYLVLDSHNRVKIPNIYQNIYNFSSNITKQELCNSSKVTFLDSEGKEIKKSGGYLELGKNEDTKIYATYTIDNKKYRCEISVLKQGSSISSTSGNNRVQNGVVGSLSIDEDSSNIKAYKQYIIDKKYINDYQDYFTDSGVEVSRLRNVGYSIVDINQDGVYELILIAYTEEDMGWPTNIIYTYQNGSVSLVDVIYNYGGIRYDSGTNEVVYSSVRPTMVTGGYGFYRLVGNRLSLVKSVGHDRGYFDVYTGEYQYDKHFYFDSNGVKTEITEEEENSYFDNVVGFSYYDITMVS